MRAYLNKKRTGEKPRPGTVCASVMVPEEAERWAALQPEDKGDGHRHYPAAWALGLPDQPDKTFPSGIGLWKLPVPNMVFVSAPADMGIVCPACDEGPGADLMPALLMMKGRTFGLEVKEDQA